MGYRSASGSRLTFIGSVHARSRPSNRASNLSGCSTRQARDRAASSLSPRRLIPCSRCLIPPIRAASFLNPVLIIPHPPTSLAAKGPGTFEERRKRLVVSRRSDRASPVPRPSHLRNIHIPSRTDRRALDVSSSFPIRFAISTPGFTEPSFRHGVPKVIPVRMALMLCHWRTRFEPSSLPATAAITMNI